MLSKPNPNDKPNNQVPNDYGIMNNENTAHNLEILNEVTKLVGGVIPMPKVVVVGSQSAGKSSLLSALTGVLFPVGAGTCTKCPIKVTVKKNEVKCFRVGTSIMEPQEYAVFKGYSAAEQARDAIAEAQISILEAEKIRQKVDIQGDGYKSKKFTSSEVIVIVEDPSITTDGLTLIDLPGLVANGNDVEYVKRMVAKYIIDDNTLILLLRKAGTDKECAPAIDFVLHPQRGYDRNHTRTLEVITKCDIFDSEDDQKIVTNEILANLEQWNGVHAVCVRPGGCKQYDAMKERLKLKQLSENISEHAGVPTLMKRLATLLNKNIIDNLSKIKNQIAAVKKKCNDKLQTLGTEEKDPTEILVRCKKHFLTKIVDTEAEITVYARKFSEKIFASQEEEKDEDIWRRHKQTIFDPIQFQGQFAMEQTIKVVIMKFKKIADEYKQNVMDVYKNIYRHGKPEAIALRLENSLDFVWNQEYDNIDVNVDSKIKLINTKYAEYSTLDQEQMKIYLQKISITLPKDFIDKKINELCKELKEDDFYREESTNFIEDFGNGFVKGVKTTIDTAATLVTAGNDFVSNIGGIVKSFKGEKTPKKSKMDKNDFANIQIESIENALAFNSTSSKSSKEEVKPAKKLEFAFENVAQKIIDKFTEPMKENEQEEYLMFIKKQQIVSATQAYLAIMAKDYIDEIQKVIKCEIRDQRNYWIENKILTDRFIQEMAGEDDAIKKERKDLSDLINKLDSAAKKIIEVRA